MTFTLLYGVLSVFSLVTIIFGQSPPSSGILLPTRTTAVFYESPEKAGLQVAYSDGAEAWSDVQQLLGDNDLVSPALLCVHGVWLIYNNPEFAAPTDSDVQLLSGNDNCINTPDVSTIRAMQPVSPLKMAKNSLTLFPKKYFGSFGRTFSVNDGSIQLLQDHFTEVGSLVVLGSQPWSLLNSKGKIMCIRPRPNAAVEEPISLCYASNLASVWVENFQVVGILADCPDEHHPSIVANVKVLECRQFGSENIETLQSRSPMGRSIDGALECKNVTLDQVAFTEEETALIKKLLKIRFTHDFQKSEQILWPNSVKNIWKTVPLDTAFDIMIATVPREIVNVPYLQMIREFTVYHLNEVWTAMGDQASNPHVLKAWRHHKVIVHLLTKCLKLATDKVSRYTQNIRRAYKLQSSVSDFNNQIAAPFKMNMSRDPVIETAYVVANYAMGLCHEIFEYRLNFWDNFLTTFYHLYFLPLDEKWKNPTTISPRTFRVILSGFGTEVQYKRIAFATSVILEFTPNLQPFEKDYTKAPSKP